MWEKMFLLFFYLCETKLIYDSDTHVAKEWNVCAKKAVPPSKLVHLLVYNFLCKLQLLFLFES